VRGEPLCQLEQDAKTMRAVAARKEVVTASRKTMNAIDALKKGAVE
jgi:hypothetical protein